MALAAEDVPTESHTGIRALTGEAFATRSKGLLPGQVVSDNLGSSGQEPWSRTRVTVMQLLVDSVQQPVIGRHPGSSSSVGDPVLQPAR